MFGAAKREKTFKDYCLILQVHPEADGAMIDAAYWHLAKRYNQATAFDPKARAKIEELNEAYIVLGSAEKREEYMRLRAQVLGEGALPQVPKPVAPVPPLTVMARQRPRERDEPAAEKKAHSGFARRFALGTIVAVGISGVALMATLSLLVASAALAAVLAALLAVAGLVAALARLRAGGRANQPRARANVVPAAKRPPGERISEPPPAASDSVTQTYSRPQSETPAVDDAQIASLKAATRKLRAAAKSLADEQVPQNGNTTAPEPPAPAPPTATAPAAQKKEALGPVDVGGDRVDRAQIEQIKAETEKLRAAQRQGAQKPPPPTLDEAL